MKPKNFLVFYKDSNLEEHRQLIAFIRKTFNKYKLKASFRKRSKFNKKIEGGYDLVLSVGGDGTLLRAANRAGNRIIFGINSNPQESEGALCSARTGDLEAKLERVIEGNFSVKKFTKARVYVKGKGKSYDALNEIYIGSAVAYITSRYGLKFNRIKEEQKSSGIVVATGLGSTAWYSSITGGCFEPERKELRFVVREPYQGRLSGVRLKEGRIAKKAKLAVKSKMRDAVLAIDSIMEVPLSNREEVEIGISPDEARFIFFR